MKQENVSFNFVHNPDSSITVLWGIWVLLRAWPSGRILHISLDAPVKVMKQAEKAVHGWFR